MAYTLTLDVRSLPADGATIDALARLRLALRRAGAELALVDASPELVELLDLAGLLDVLGVEVER